tara:strand:- start:131 stop:574 length:444 start_codon:yes stop_codon:yes gene_type:complete
LTRVDVANTLADPAEGVTVGLGNVVHAAPSENCVDVVIACGTVPGTTLDHGLLMFRAFQIVNALLFMAYAGVPKVSTFGIIIGAGAADVSSRDICTDGGHSVADICVASSLLHTVNGAAVDFIGTEDGIHGIDLAGVAVRIVRAAAC